MKPDDELQDDVIAALKADAHVASACIGVAVKRGVVEPSGEARNQAEKRVVEQLVRAVAGGQGSGDASGGEPA